MIPWWSTSTHHTFVVCMKYMFCDKPIECTTPRMNPNGKDRLWVIMMCECRFISHKKCTTLVGDVDSGWVSTCVPRGIWAIFVPSPKTAMKPETALESKVLI